MSFGEELKKLRESKGMTVNQLAIYSGVSSASISRYETGDRSTPKPPTIEKLAKGLKVDYKRLMVMAGYVEPNKKESEMSPSESAYDLVIREVEREYGINLRDDPTANKMIREIILGVAKMKSENE